MATIKLQGNASGSGSVTLTAPNTNSARTITLPDQDVDFGSLGGAGNVGAWAKINASSGTPVIGGDGNVSSVTDLGVGALLFNFSASLTDANYTSNSTTSGRVNGTHTLAFFSNFGTEVSTYTSSQLQVSCYSVTNSNARGDNEKVTLIVVQ